MRKYLYLLLISSGIWLAGCKAEEENKVVTGTIPTANITTDGEVDDWAGLSTALSDGQGDQSGSSSQDLRSLYVAQDSAALFIRLTLDGEVNLHHETTASFSYIQVAIFNYRGDCSDGSQLGHLMAELSSDGVKAQSSLEEFDAEGSLGNTSGVLTSSLGTNLEIQIPLSDLISGSTQIGRAHV